MSIAFQCPACKATRNAPDVVSGRRVRCPECNSLVEFVPLSPSVAVEVEEIEPGMDVAMTAEESESVDDVVLLEPVNVVPAPAPLLLPQGRGLPPKPPTQPKQDEEEPPPRPKKAQLVETEMDMTPMVDATFQLLIFFMITAAFALQKSKEIPKPKSDEPSTNVVVPEDDASNAVIVKIDQFNSFIVVNADGDEQEAPSVVDLHAALRRAHESDSEGRTPTKLRVEAHGEALHERVIAAIDAGNDVGFAEVELASMEEEA